MPRIRHEKTGIKKQINWRKWTVSPHFINNREEWKIINFEPLPIELFKRNNANEPFKRKAIWDITEGEQRVSKDSKLYRFDELNPKTLEGTKSNAAKHPKKKLPPFQWYGNISRTWSEWTSYEKTTIVIMILALIGTVIIPYMLMN